MDQIKIVPEIVINENRFSSFNDMNICIYISDLISEHD